MEMNNIRPNLDDHSVFTLSNATTFILNACIVWRLTGHAVRAYITSGHDLRAVELHAMA